jgi:thiamine pyrophosphokinase
MNNPDSRVVIVADGSFPYHEIPLGYIRKARSIICCDGSTRNLIDAGFIPDAIVGDMDSLSPELAGLYADRLFKTEEQETNDLTKSVKWCADKGYDNLVITGATGKREDHTIGNVSLLAEYATYVKVIMVTDTGYFIPLDRSAELASFVGQQISIFSIDCDTEITSHNLKYQLFKTRLSNWWQATLNESLDDSFSINFDKGRLIVYLKFRDHFAP